MNENLYYTYIKVLSNKHRLIMINSAPCFLYFAIGHGISSARDIFTNRWFVERIKGKWELLNPH